MGFASSKAISPMIATVLLIAFTVAVGGILSLWLNSLTTTTTNSVENSTTDQIKCASTWINVVSVGINATLLQNAGSQTITAIQCFSGNGSSWRVGNLAPGEMNATKWSSEGTNGSYSIGFGTVITCSGKCLAIGVSGECKSGQSCWDV